MNGLQLLIQELKCLWDKIVKKKKKKIIEFERKKVLKKKKINY